MDALLNTLIYIVIPLLTVVILSVVKQSLLRAAPLISTVLAFIAYVMVFSIAGVSIVDILVNSEWRIFCFLAMLIQLVVVITLTVIASCLTRAIYTK